MDWAQIFTFVGANFITFLWMVRENNHERKQIYQLLRDIKVDTTTLSIHLSLMEEREKNKCKKEK